MFGYAAIVLAAMISTVVCHEDSYEVKRMLEKLTEQNKQLEKKLETITAGLTDMCRAVNLVGCDCKGGDKTGTDKATGKADNDLKLLSLEWQEEMDDSVQLTFKFEASDGYGMEWFQMFNRGNGMIRSPGKLSKTKLLKNRHLYTSDIELRDLNFTRQLFIRIYSQNTTIIVINETTLRESGEHQFKDIEYEITKYDQKVILPDELGEEYNLTINVSRNILELEEKSPGYVFTPNYYYTFINTTANGYSIDEVYGVSLSQNDNGIGDIEITFTIKTDLLENGGMFTVLLRQIGDRLINEMWYGVVIELFRKGRESIIPEGSVAVFNQLEHIYAASSSTSIYCYAMGNPTPDVRIFKVQKTGMKELKSDIIMNDRYTLLRSVVLHDSKKKGKGLVGTYTCQATNGQETMITNTTVHRYKAVEFDERKTGIVVNSTRKVVVSCKASGNPTPKLEIRVGDSYGPDLLKAKGKFTSKVSSKRDTSKVVITFSPVDDRFYTVFCVAIQDDYQMHETFEKEIRIFRDKSETDWSFDKFPFYDSLRSTY